MNPAKSYDPTICGDSITALRCLQLPKGYRVRIEGGMGIVEPHPPSAWNGPEDGLPPVGLEVLTDHSGRTFKVKILAYAPKNGKTAVMVEETEAGDNKGCLFAWMAHMCNFRPIRTAKQLAAEERERQIQRMAVVIYQGFQTGEKLADKLYDAGARMPGEGSKP